MRTSSILPVLALFVLTGCGTGAPGAGRWKPNAEPARDENWHSQSASLMRYDLNHDDVLTREELLSGLKSEFDGYSSKHNNCLAPDVVRGINQQRVQQDASQATPLVDWNQDSCIDFQEFSGSALSLFDTLDANRDARVTLEELKPGNHPPLQPNLASGPAGGHDGRGQGEVRVVREGNSQ